MTSPSDTIRLKSRRSFGALALAPADPIIDLTGPVARLDLAGPLPPDDGWVFSDALPLMPAVRPVPNPSRWSSVAVRVFDVVVALVGLVLAAPLMAVVAIAVAVDSPGPVFYGSLRLANGGGTFRAWKFRSMRPGAEHELDEILAADPSVREEFERYLKLRHDPRLTRVGALLRQTSIDELPQLVNILLGQMSVVGPRPNLVRDAEAYGEHLGLVLSVKPGLTGLWQVSGRSGLPLSERIALDLQYLQERSFRGDLLICFRTFLQLCQPGRHGAF